MKYKITLLATLLCFNTIIQAQNLFPTLRGSDPIPVHFPVMMDSVNPKNEKFEAKTLLKMEVNISETAIFPHLFQPDTAGFFILQKPEGEAAFQFFKFDIQTDRYASGKLKITSPNMMEVYVDGKLATSKTTKEDSLHLSKDISTSITPYPISKHILIKLLAFSNDSIPPAIKLSWENEKRDSLAQFSFQMDEKRFVNFTDMLKGKRVTATSISPQGNFALISYRETTGVKSFFYKELYNIKTGSRIILDRNGSMRQLAWMPKSEKLYYIYSTDQSVDLMTIDPQTLQQSVLAENIPDHSISFAPDELSFYFSTQDDGKKESGDLRLLKSVRDRQPGYENRSQICKYDLKTGLSQQLTFGQETAWLNDISSDGKKILFSVSRELITERPFSRKSLFLLDVESMRLDTLLHDLAFVGGASFSPDNKQLLITGSGEAFGGIGLNIAEGQTANMYHNLAYIMTIETKDIQCITKDFAPSVQNCFWNMKDHLIYFLTVDKDYQNVYTYHLPSRKFTKLNLNEEVVRGFETASDALTSIYYGVSLTNSTKAYVYDLKTAKSTLIADPYNDQLSDIQLGDIQDWNFTNSDGVEIEGRYFLPPNFDSSKKYPMIVYYYAGTTPTPRTYESPYPGHVFAAQGYVVYVIQPSGTIGYGQEFAAMHVNAWGKRTGEDIIEGTRKFLRDHSFVDESKIGCIGASYGGFMTMYLLTQTDLFAAAVSHAGISSLSSYWGEGYWGYSYSSAASAHSYPWNNHDLYVKQSPLYNADKIKTPLLLTHGLEDTNVPIGESIQMYTALKILGTPVEFLQVKGENHGVMNYARRVNWNNSIMAWFDKWLKEDTSWWDALYQQK